MNPISMKLKSEMMWLRLSMHPQAYDRIEVYKATNQPVLRSITSTTPSV